MNSESSVSPEMSCEEKSVRRHEDRSGMLHPAVEEDDDAAT